MRIGLVIDHLDPGRGGAEQWTFQHVQGLLARGHEVHIVARDIAGPAMQLPLVPHCLEDIRSPTGKAQAAETMLRSLDLDVIHDVGLGWYGDVLQSEDGSRLAQWEQKLLLLPPWMRPAKRALLWLMPRYRGFRRLVARQYNDPRRIIVAVSKMCARDYRRYHGVEPQRIRLVYHGTDNERFSPDHRTTHRAPIREQHGIADDEVVFLFVGHDYLRKGLATAIRAVERLAIEGHRARLLVLGGNRRSRQLQLTEQQRATVTLAGSVGDPVPYYAAADAFVLPTFYDPCSLSVSEAAASGLPSVTTQFNGAAELLTEGVDGFICDDPADDRELAQRLRMLMDPSVRRRMGAAARELALKHSLDRNCDEIIAIYHEIAAVHQGIAEQRRRAA